MVLQNYGLSINNSDDECGIGNSVIDDDEGIHSRKSVNYSDMSPLTADYAPISNHHYYTDLDAVYLSQGNHIIYSLPPKETIDSKLILSNMILLQRTTQI